MSYYRYEMWTDNGYEPKDQWERNERDLCRDHGVSRPEELPEHIRYTRCPKCGTKKQLEGED